MSTWDDYHGNNDNANHIWYALIVGAVILLGLMIHPRCPQYSPPLIVITAIRLLRSGRLSWAWGTSPIDWQFIGFSFNAWFHAPTFISMFMAPSLSLVLRGTGCTGWGVGGGWFMGKTPHRWQKTLTDSWGVCWCGSHPCPDNCQCKLARPALCVLDYKRGELWWV